MVICKECHWFGSDLIRLLAVICALMGTQNYWHINCISMYIAHPLAQKLQGKILEEMFTFDHRYLMYFLNLFSTLPFLLDTGAWPPQMTVWLSFCAA